MLRAGGGGQKGDLLGGVCALSFSNAPRVCVDVCFLVVSPPPPDPPNARASHPRKQQRQQGGAATVTLLLGDPSAAKGVLWELGTIELPPVAAADGGAATPTPAYRSARAQPKNNLLPNIAHTFVRRPRI